jgi:hypothetical protein
MKGDRTMKKESPRVHQKISPTEKRKLLKGWLARDPGEIPSLARVKEILEPKIKAQHERLLSDEWLYNRLKTVTENFVCRLKWNEIREKIPPRDLQRCRRAFIQHLASLRKIEEKFPYAMDISEIEWHYSSLIGLLENVKADFGRKQINTPLKRYVYNLALIYHEWTGAFPPSTREPIPPFSQLVIYCIESLKLHGIWSDDALLEVIDETIRSLPKYDEKRII